MENIKQETGPGYKSWPGSWHLPVFIQDFPEPHQFCPILREYYILKIGQNWGGKTAYALWDP